MDDEEKIKLLADTIVIMAEALEDNSEVLSIIGTSRSMYNYHAFSAYSHCLIALGAARGTMDQFNIDQKKFDA